MRGMIIKNKKTVEATAEYVDGKKNGTQYDYFPNGNLRLLIEFEDENNNRLFINDEL